MKTTNNIHKAFDRIPGATCQTAEAPDKKGGRHLMNNYRSYILDNPITSLGIAVVFGFLLSGSLLELVSVTMLMLVENGVRLSSAILLAVAFNFLIALILWGVIRRQSRYLQFHDILCSLPPMPTKCRDAKHL